MPEHNALARQFTLPSLMRFALPNIIMMVFLSMYTIVDGMFISRYVGTLALSSEMVTNITNAITIEGFPIYAVSFLFMGVSIFRRPRVRHHLVCAHTSVSGRHAAAPAACIG